MKSLHNSSDRLQVWEGHNVVRSSRMLVGDTDPAGAAPGTIRGDLSVHISRYETIKCKYSNGY